MKRLRYRVDIYEETSAAGAEVPSYTIWKREVPCDSIQVSGGEIYRGKQIHANATHVFEMRYLADVVPTMKFIQGSKTYFIDQIGRRAGRDHMLDVQAHEVVE